ncbi:Ig-like domain-containing protein [Acholeplasma granularum]|uniref:Ig-like domain-containing protein n=1 Tax=Acholeplasma granularum TaxID=264635 RepID=UPI00047042D0|nr:Ig-like domain-containing protein [Acholeplasma granularum]
MKKLLSIMLVALFALVLVTNQSFALEKTYLYNGVNHEFGTKEAKTVYNAELTTTTPVTFTGESALTSITKTTSSPNAVLANLTIENDTQLNQNVYSLNTSNISGVTSGNAISEMKMGRLANVVAADDNSTGNSTALHLDINYVTYEVSWFQLFARNGGKIGGANTNVLGKIMHMRWISGPGTNLYFGNADSANATNYNLPNTNFKLWEDFSINKWYKLVIVLNDNGAKEQDSIDYFVDGKHMFTKVGLAVDFNQNIEDLTITQQASGAKSNQIKFAHIYTTKLNRATQINAANKTVTTGEEFQYELDLVGPNVDNRVTFDQYDVQIENESILTYDAQSNKFLALNVEEATSTNVTFTLTSTKDEEPAIAKTVSVTVEPTTEDILPTSVNQENLLGDLKLVVGERLNLNGLFSVSPETTTNKTLTYTITDLSNDVVSVQGNELVGVSAGSKQLTVTSVADPTKTITVNIEVKNAIIEGLNDFNIATTYPESNPTNFIDGWASRGSGSKTYGLVDMYLDPVFGVVPRINGAGLAANAGATTIFNRILFNEETPFVADKDYILRGYIKVEGTNLGSHRGEVKILVLKEGNTALGSALPYTTAFQLANNAGNQDRWVYFETSPINADILAGAIGFQIEAISWNSNDGANVSFANFGFVEQDTVQMISSQFVYNNELATDMTANLNDELQFGIKYVPSKATSDVLYQTSNEEVATVDANGLVKIVGYGTVEISSTVNTVTSTITITVQNPVNSIVVDKNELDIIAGQNGVVNVTINPADYTDVIEVIVENDAVISYTFVEGQLTITGKSIGSSKITVKVQGKAIEQVIDVTVLDVPVTNITLRVDGEEVTSLNGVETSSITLQAVVSPVTRVDKTVTYQSSNESVFTVSASGVITLLAPGTAELTVKAGDFEKVVEVTVTAEQVLATDIIVDVESLTLKVDGKGKINATLNPTNASGTISFTSSNPSVVTVDEAGNVTAISSGEAQIIITSGVLSQTVDVVVEQESTSSNNSLIVILSSIGAVILLAGATAFIIVKKKRVV